jgi:hypothetical protein
VQVQAHRIAGRGYPIGKPRGHRRQQSVAAATAGVAIRGTRVRAASCAASPMSPNRRRVPQLALAADQSRPGTGIQVIVTVHLVAVSVLIAGPVSSRPSVWLVPCTAQQLPDGPNS